MSNRDDKLGVRTEIKNIGSPRAVAAAVKYEINRHISVLDAGDEIFNETRAWDTEGKRTILMREKEDKEVIYDPRFYMSFLISYASYNCSILIFVS